MSMKPSASSCSDEFSPSDDRVLKVTWLNPGQPAWIPKAARSRYTSRNPRGGIALRSLQPLDPSVLTGSHPTACQLAAGISTLLKTPKAVVCEPLPTNTRQGGETCGELAHVPVL